MSPPARKRRKAKPSRASKKAPGKARTPVVKPRKAARKKATGGAKKKVRRSSKGAKGASAKPRKVAAKKKRALRKQIGQRAGVQSKRGARKAAERLSRTELLRRYTELLTREESRERKIERDRDYRARRKQMRLELRDMLERGERVLGVGAVSQMLADHHQTEHAFWIEFRREYKRAKR